tara:strand:+ start:863 stop:1519 length:657 start_codon:yes stop_codon:yes gene_type:complete
MANLTQKHESARLKAIYRDCSRRLNLTHAKIAARMKVEQGSVSHFLNGRNPIPLGRAREFAEIMECEIADFSPRLAAEAADLGHAVGDSVFVDVVLLAGMEAKEIIRKIKSGKLFVDDNELIYWPTEHSTKTIAITVEGDEAEPRIQEGSLAFVDLEASADKGDMVLIRIGNSELLFVEVKNQGYLEIINPSFPDRRFKAKDRKAVVVGKVVGMQVYL